MGVMLHTDDAGQWTLDDGRWTQDPQHHTISSQVS